MKKQLIIPIVLLSTIMPIASLINVATNTTSNITTIETTTKDIKQNLVNYQQDLISSNTTSPVENLERLKSFEFSEEIWIVVPDVQKLYLNNKDLLSKSQDQHDKYRVGMEININVLDTGDDTEDNESTTLGDHNPFSEPFYLGYNPNLEDSSKFSWSNQKESEKLAMNKTDGEIPGEEWTYDLSGIAEILKDDHTLNSSTDIANDANDYWNAVSPFIIQGKVSWSEQDEKSDSSYNKKEREWEVQNLSPNDIYLYGQTYEGPDLPTDSLINAKYLIDKDSHPMSDFKGVPIGTAITIVILSMIAIAGVGWMAMLFFRPDKDTNAEVEAEQKKLKEEARTHHWIPTHPHKKEESKTDKVSNKKEHPKKADKDKLITKEVKPVDKKEVKPVDKKEVKPIDKKEVKPVDKKEVKTSDKKPPTKKPISKKDK